LKQLHRERSTMADSPKCLGFPQCARLVRGATATAIILVLTIGPVRLAARALAAEESQANVRPPATLESRLMPLIEAHKGKVTLAVKHLGSGESFCYHGDEVMPTASLIKFPVMIEAYRQAAANQIELDGFITLKKQDKVGGSGVLTYHFSDGSRIKLRDAV